VNRQSFTNHTPLGTLSIVASGSYTVDWGTGAWTGPYAGTGHPWPNGHITHYWDNSGSYPVTVKETWTVTWSLAGSSGSLGGFYTTGAIPSFPVQQLRAVRLQ
ncbi:MAG: hypothetical protein ACYDH5_16015, partial [Acidimicrobiales bacterium]